MRYFMYGLMSLLLILNTASAKPEGSKHRHKGRHQNTELRQVSRVVFKGNKAIGVE
jgi:hypothetical protein